MNIGFINTEVFQKSHFCSAICVKVAVSPPGIDPVTLVKCFDKNLNCSTELLSPETPNLTYEFVMLIHLLTVLDYSR